MKSGKKAAYTVELLALGVSPAWFVLVDSVFGTDYGVIPIPGKVDCWSAGKVPTVARGSWHSL